MASAPRKYAWRRCASACACALSKGANTPGRLPNLSENGPDGDWDGEAFDEEMLVMAHFPPALVQAFLQGLRRAGVRPGGLKAVLTPTNAQWDSLALYTELCREREAIAQGAASVHGQAEEKA